MTIVAKFAAEHMSASPEFTEYVLELLEPLGAIESRRLFGGVGISSDAVQFAIIMGNTLYFVVDETTREKYVQAQREPFSYMTKKGQVYVKRYYEVPEDLFENHDELIKWAGESIAVAKKTSKKSKRK
jgi:DNA transformation protein